MNDDLDIDIYEELAELFQQTAEAHHQAYIATDGADPDWPLWYADYLHEKLGQKLNAGFTRSELVYLLVMVDRDLAADAPGANWPTYYSNFFIERYL